jgi:hypothetical protein
MANNGWVECAGQTAPRDQFDELWRVIGTNWGALDKFTFLLPDLRGEFIRGWQHGKTLPPDQSTHVPPYTGDIDVSRRVMPRPEAFNAGGNGGQTGDHVGSMQAANVGPHEGDTNNFPSGDESQNMIEDHPSNSYMMYFIYVGKPAQVIAGTPATIANTKLATDRIECYKKSDGKCRTKPED